MLRSRTLLIQFAIFICVLLIGCSTSNGSKLNMSTDLAKSPYTDEQLLEIAGFTGSIKEITNSYKTNYIKKTANVHFVVFRGESKILLLTFDSSGNKVLESFHNMTVAKSAFDMISVGSKLSDVQMIDPEGEYLFLYTGRNDVPKVSTHYTTDGFLVSITYDVDNTVLKIESEPM